MMSHSKPQELMKRQAVLLTLAAAALLWMALRPRLASAQTAVFQIEEYVTIRWDGPENTHVIRPSGKSESLGSTLGKIPRPSRTDERAFYMSLAMNALAREGYVFAGMNPDEIVMTRPVAR